MSKHVIEFPDCPKCGEEMIRQMKHKELDNGGFYKEPFFYWECSKCNIRTPYCTIGEDFTDVALKWVKERRGIDR